MSSLEASRAAWERQQNKAFVAWLNSRLRTRHIIIKDIIKDFQDGVNLCHLAMVLTGSEIKYDAAPKSDIHKLQNISKALESFKSAGIGSSMPDGHELLHGDAKLNLAMCWGMIRKFEISSELGESEKAAKDGLLLWFKKNTKGYKGVDVKNFTTSCQDGLAFVALLNHFRSDLIKFDDLPQDEPSTVANRLLALNRAVDFTEKTFDIPQMLDIDGLADIAVKPDERSVMTYVSMIYRAVQSTRGKYDSALLIKKEVDAASQNERNKSNYILAAKQLSDELKRRIAVSEQRDRYPNIEDKERQLESFQEYMASEKKELGKKRIELEQLHAALQTKLRLEKKDNFQPPEAYSIDTINNLWNDLTGKDREFFDFLNKEITDYQDRLSHDWADKAAEFTGWCNLQKNVLEGDVPGTDIEEKLYAMQYIAEDILEGAGKLDTLSKLHKNLENAHVTDNKYSDDTQLGLELAYQQLQNTLRLKQNLLEDVKLNSENQHLSPEEIKELKESFDYFDKDGNDALGRLEFKSALKTLGIDINNEDELDRAIDEADTNRDKTIGLNEFIAFMQKRKVKGSGYDDVLAAFQQLAHSKDHITLEELCAYPDDLLKKNVEYMMKIAGDVEGIPGCKDYKAFSSFLFS